MRGILAAGFGLVLTLAMGDAALADGPTVVLDLDCGSYRAHIMFQTPTLISDGQLKPLLPPKGQEPEPIVKCDPAPADFAATDFDDSGWPRVRGEVIVNQYAKGTIYTPGNAGELRRVCLRGRFLVDDPTKVGKLNLSLSYRGGVAVYMNGKELTRANLPAGQLKADTLADPYPAEAYFAPDGTIYREGDERKSDLADRMKVRTRQLEMAVPAAALRKGVNVLAIESLSSPLEARSAGFKPGPWPHAGIMSAKLLADIATGLTPATAPTDAVTLFTCLPLENVQSWDVGLPAETVAPVRIVAARNGQFSGQVVLSCGQSIRNITATASPLIGPGGAKLPAEAVRVRWAEPARQELSRNLPTNFERLLDQLPAEVKPEQASIRGRKVQPAPVAVVPIWISVKPPADAAPGDYEATLDIKCQNGRGADFAFAVPVRVKVHGWNVPSPAEFTVRHNLFQSPESVGLWHKADMWSDRHFELIGKSLTMLSEIGNGLCVLPLVEQAPNIGNRQSMVRWVRHKDGTFTQDYTILDRYLATYRANCPAPWIVVLYAWSYYKENDPKHPITMLPVTVVDAETGKISSMVQPVYGTRENQEFWQPVLGEVRKRLEKIGWFDRTAMGFTSYAASPTKSVIDVYRAIWPDGKWMNSSHSNPTVWGGMPVPYSEWVWGCGECYNPDRPGKAKSYPAPWTAGASRIQLANPRIGQGVIRIFTDSSPLAAYRFISEAAYQAGVRGIGHVGGDFWPVPIGSGRYGVMANADFAVGMPNSVTAFTCPAPDGVAGTTRYEMFREGIQTTEAIVFLQRAMLDKKVSVETSARINKLLDDRARYYLRTGPFQPANWWAMECSRWQHRDDALFALAAEVAKATGN